MSTPRPSSRKLAGWATGATAAADCGRSVPAHPGRSVQLLLLPLLCSAATSHCLLLHHTACSTAAHESDRLSSGGRDALSTPRPSSSTCRTSACRTGRPCCTLPRGTPARSKTGSDPGEARSAHWSKRPPRPPRLPPPQPPQPAASSASGAPRRALCASAAWPAQKVRGHWAQGDVAGQ